MVCPLERSIFKNSTPQIFYTLATQRERDPESSLMHYRARSYDPRLGRFVQKDPAMRNRPLEHYVYVRNNPMRYTDPTGEYWYLPGTGDASPIRALKLASAYFGYDLTIESIGNGAYRVKIVGPKKGGFAKDYFQSNFEDTLKNETVSLDLSDLMDRVIQNDPEGYKKALNIEFDTAWYERAAEGMETGVYGFNEGVTLGARRAPTEIRNRPGFAWGRRGGFTTLIGSLFLAGALAGEAAGGSAVTGGAAGGGGAINETLKVLMSSGGPTVMVVTKLTQSPAVGRALSVATGPNATNLANAARQTGQIFVARIPKDLIEKLIEIGYAQEFTTLMNGVIGKEIRFYPQASEYIIPFFK